MAILYSIGKVASALVDRYRDLLMTARLPNPGPTTGPATAAKWPWVLPAVPTVFVRHGESEANLADVVAGSSDIPLTARGRAQAAAAAERLAGFHAAAVYTSALRRARDTAEIIAAVRRLPVCVEQDLGERNWGAWEGQPRVGLDRAATPPGGEGPAAFSARVLRCLGGIAWRTPAIIVGHAGTFRVLAAHLGLPDSDDRIGNAAPLRLIPPQGADRIWRLEPI